MVLYYFGCCLFTDHILCWMFLGTRIACSNWYLFFLLLFFLYLFLSNVFDAMVYLFTIVLFGYYWLDLLNLFCLDYLLMILVDWFLWILHRLLFLVLTIRKSVVNMMKWLLLYLRILNYMWFLYLMFDTLKLFCFCDFVLILNMLCL